VMATAISPTAFPQMHRTLLPRAPPRRFQELHPVSYWVHKHTEWRTSKFPSKVKCLQESRAAGGQPGRLRPEAQRSNIYFGATWTRLFVGHPVSSVPISRVRCSKCPGASPAEYVAWGDINAPEADRREASALLAQLVEKDHPRHNAVYSGMTLEELRQRVGRKASSAGS